MYHRDNDLHKSLFMPNGLPDGTSLAYYSKGKVVFQFVHLDFLIVYRLFLSITVGKFFVSSQMILRGYKQGNGIVCSCCKTEVSSFTCML